MRTTRRNLIPLSLILSGLLLAISLSVAASPENGAVAADHSLTVAINKADQTTFGKLLESEFTWTDRTGKTRSKSEILPGPKWFD